jgi:hypothetical protein
MAFDLSALCAVFALCTVAVNSIAAVDCGLDVIGHCLRLMVHGTVRSETIVTVDLIVSFIIIIVVTLSVKYSFGCRLRRRSLLLDDLSIEFHMHTV